MNRDSEIEAVFEASSDGRFTYKNLVVERDGVSTYKVFVHFGDDEVNTVCCEVPHLESLLYLLKKLTNKQPFFTSLAGHKPTGTI